MSTRKDRNRLSLIITLWLFVFLLCGLGVAYLYLPKRVETMVAEQIGQRAITLCEQVARNAVDGLVSEDEEEKKLILAKVMESLRSERKEFSACAITDENGTIWASLDKSEIGRKYVSPVDQKGLEVERSEAHHSARAQGMVYNIAVPVVLKPRRIGVVFAEVSLAQAGDDALRIGNWILLASAILFLVGAFGTMTIVATLPLPEAAAPAAIPRGAGGSDPAAAREVDAKREEAAKLTEKIESLKNEELEMVRRLDLHQREMERLEGGGGGSGPYPEEAEAAKRLEAKRREEQLLVARIETLKKTAQDLASAPKPEHLAQEDELNQRLEEKSREEAEITKRIEAQKRSGDEISQRIVALKQEEAACLSRLEELKKQGTAAAAEGEGAPKTEELARQEGEIAQRIEAKRREEAALASKIEEIRKKVLDLDRRIESRRREELELAQRIEKRRQELAEKAGGGAGPG